MDIIRHYMGPKSFYKRACYIAIPLGLQQLVTSCMGIIDSLMVSWIGQVTAVGTAVQIETLCTSVSWACAAGVGIYSVQFFGANVEFKTLIWIKFGLSDYFRDVLVFISSNIWEMDSWFLYTRCYGY